jgi:hypothetical protein
MLAEFMSKFTQQPDSYGSFDRGEIDEKNRDRYG